MAAVLLLAAVLCLFVATLGLFGVFGLAHAVAWVALGLLFWCAAELLGAAAPYVRRG